LEISACTFDGRDTERVTVTDFSFVFCIDVYLLRTYSVVKLYFIKFHSF
jgi:hypothetical protein